MLVENTVLSRQPSVLMVTPNLHFPFGGPPVTILKIAFALSQAGLNVEIAYPAPRDSAELRDPRIIDLVERGVKFKRFDFIGSSVSVLKWGVSPALLHYVWKSAGRYDFYMMHQIWGLPRFARLSKKVAARSIVLPHESLTRFDVERTQNPITHCLKYCQLALDTNVESKILFSSDLERNVSLGIGPRTLAAVAYHPLGPDDRVLWEVPVRAGGQLKVGFIGRLHAKKNVEGLIRALAELPDVSLVIAGSEGQEQGLKELAQSLSVGDRIEWLGFVTGPAKDEFYKSIHVSAVPSVFECFGQSAAEAMLYGIPLLCTSNVGASERLEDGVSCIRCGTEPATIVAALRRFMTCDPSKQRDIGLEGQKAALKYFSNAAFVETVLSLLAMDNGP